MVWQWIKGGTADDASGNGFVRDHLRDSSADEGAHGWDSRCSKTSISSIMNHDIPEEVPVRYPVNLTICKLAPGLTDILP